MVKYIRICKKDCSGNNPGIKEASLVQAESNEKASPGGMSPERRKRIQRLKKMIVATIVTAVLLPTLISIILGVRLVQVTKELQSVKEQNALNHTNIAEAQDETLDSVSDSVDTEESVTEENIVETVLPEDVRKVYLTFDDGPSIYTDEILDILALYEVKATFFVVGAVDEQYESMYKRIVDEGHSIGMHSYSHKYTEVYQSLDSFKADVEKIRGLIKDKTGVECSLYRFPGGSSNSIGKKHIQDYIAYLDEEGIIYHDWNVSSGDASGVYLSVDDLVKNSTSQLEKYNSAYILLHDSSTKKSTVDALPKIIETIQAMENTEIVPITESSVPVQQVIKQ